MYTGYRHIALQQFFCRRLAYSVALPYKAMAGRRFKVFCFEPNAEYMPCLLARATVFLLSDGSYCSNHPPSTTNSVPVRQSLQIWQVRAWQDLHYRFHLVLVIEFKFELVNLVAYVLKFFDIP